MGSAVNLLKRTREVMKKVLSLLLCFLLGAGQLRFHKENLLWQERWTAPEPSHWRNSLPARPALPSRAGTSTGMPTLWLRRYGIRCNLGIAGPAPCLAVPVRQLGCRGYGHAGTVQRTTGGIAGPGRHGISAYISLAEAGYQNSFCLTLPVLPEEILGLWSRRQPALSLCQPIAVRYRYKLTNGKTERITYFSCLRKL